MSITKSLPLMKHTPLLTTTALSYSYQGRQILNEMSFDLYGGQKVTLMGRSGSGKSMLLKCLADLLPTNNPSIQINKDGQLTPISAITPYEYRSIVALFHQTPNLSEGTVLDNLTLPFRFKYHHHKKFNLHWHKACLDKLGKNSDFLNQSVHEISGGERQLVNFLRTLQFEPTIALFDETTSTLDNQTSELLMDLVLTWHDNTKAFIWVTHTPNEQHYLKAEQWYMDKGILKINYYGNNTDAH